MPYNIWRDEFLNDQPEIAYAAYRPQSGSNSFLDYWRKAYGDVRNQYEQQLGGMALAGQPPALNWTDMLAGYPFMQRYAGLSPQERGGQRESDFAPGLRWRL